MVGTVQEFSKKYYFLLEKNLAKVKNRHIFKIERVLKVRINIHWSTLAKFLVMFQMRKTGSKDKEGEG